MSEDHIKEMRDVAFRKIERNLLNFQMFERVLKLIIVRSDLRGYSSELPNILQNKDKNIERKPFGKLVQEYFETVYSDRAHIGPADARDEAWMSFCFRLESNENVIQHRKRQLREIVKERNLLVHRLLANFDPDSVESCEKLIQLLDEQVDRLIPHYQSLMAIIEHMQATQQEILKQLADELRQSAREEGDAV